MKKIFWCLMFLAVSPLMAGKHYVYNDGEGNQWTARQEQGPLHSCFKNKKPVQSCHWTPNTKGKENCPAQQACCNEKARIANAGEVCKKLHETKTVCADTPPPCDSVQKAPCVTKASSCGPRPRPCGTGAACNIGCVS